MLRCLMVGLGLLIELAVAWADDSAAAVPATRPATTHAVGEDSAGIDKLTTRLIGLLDEPNEATEKIAEGELPRTSFRWKALWANGNNIRSADEARRMAELAARMGFNTILYQVTGDGTCYYDSRILVKPKGLAIDPLKDLIGEARKKNIDVYAWIIYLASSGGESMRKEHPEYYQVIRPEEQASLGARWLTPDRPNAKTGEWLCPDRGLADHEKQITQEILRNYRVAGIAVDYLGYRNYYACLCEYSQAQRAEFARRPRPKSLTPEEVMKEYSEESLENWTRQLRAAVHAAKPDAKIAIHVYPDFAPNPLYGNRLHVDYCGQTIAWLYRPFWSYGKVYNKAAAYKQAEGKFHDFNRFVPFVGVEQGALLKSPERLRQEIRIAGLSGAKDIMIAFHKVFRDHPELAEAVAGELNAPSPASASAPASVPADGGAGSRGLRGDGSESPGLR